MRAAPDPGVPKPERRQKVKLAGFWPAICDSNTNQDIVGRAFRVLGKNIEIAVLLKNSRVHQFKLRCISSPAPILGDQLAIRKLGLRIFVERLQVGSRRRGIQIEIFLLDVLAMVALRTGQTEEPLFENWITAIPESQPNANPALTISDAEKSVLTPAISPTPGMVMGKMLPGLPVRRVILA